MMQQLRTLESLWKAMGLQVEREGGTVRVTHHAGKALKPVELRFLALPLEYTVDYRGTRIRFRGLFPPTRLSEEWRRWGMHPPEDIELEMNVEQVELWQDVPVSDEEVDAAMLAWRQLDTAWAGLSKDELRTMLEAARKARVAR